MKENWKKLLLVVGSIIFTLLIGELLLQLNFRIKNGQWLWESNQFKVDYIIPTDDRRQYTLRPDYYDVVQNMPINKRGERTTEQPLSLEDTQNVIVCLGDSVPFGFGVGNNDTYPFFLAKTLAERGFNYYVINGGIPSYNLRQSFDRLKFDVLKHIEIKDIKVVTIQAANDISLMLHYRENWTPDLTWADVRFNIYPIPFSNYLATSYYISQLISQPRGSDNDFDFNMVFEQLTVIIEEEIREIQEISPDINIILLPVNPFYYQTTNQDENTNLQLWENNSKYLKNREQLNLDIYKVLFEISKKCDNVFFLDIKSEMDLKDRNDFYKDYIHLSPEGNKFQAELMAEFLIENGLIKSEN
ncbi:MAG TPA: SGNH/GDSL hydrolase family protein [Pelolinea sp.]|nr:SGNH/GDSL hydrolase family protein [Pelolinea sp.]